MDWSIVTQVLSYLAAALATALAALMARKQSKEDHNLSKISEAVDTWQEIAKENYKHRTECEAQLASLRTEVHTLTQNYYEERSRRSNLELKIIRLENRIKELEHNGH